jgi:hypothetical protein
MRSCWATTAGMRIEATEHGEHSGHDQAEIPVRPNGKKLESSRSNQKLGLVHVGRRASAYLHTETVPPPIASAQIHPMT